MAQKVQRLRGQGVEPLTLEQMAAVRSRVRLANALYGRPISDQLVVWSPEETEALRAMLAGKSVTP